MAIVPFQRKGKVPVPLRRPKDRDRFSVPVLRLSKKRQSRFFENVSTQGGTRFLAEKSSRLAREVSFPRHIPQGTFSCPFGAIHLVSSEMTRLDLIPSSACARRRVSERSRRAAAALSAEKTRELLAGGLF